jgi:hypothetical protein
LYCFFEELGVLHVSTSDNFGMSWSVPVTLNVGDGVGQHEPSAVEASDGSILLAFADDDSSTTAIKVTRSTDLGDSWSTAVQVNTGDGQSHSKPQLTVASGGRVGVAWVSTESAILFSSSENHGVSWQAQIPVTQGTTLVAPELTGTLDGQFYVTWLSFDGMGTSIELALSQE